MNETNWTPKTAQMSTNTKKYHIEFNCNRKLRYLRTGNEKIEKKLKIIEKKCNKQREQKLKSLKKLINERKLNN